MKPEFWIQGPYSGEYIHQVWPPTSKHQINRPGEGREKRFIIGLGLAWEEVEQALSPSSAIFRVQT
jgi:hypothetical protein